MWIKIILLILILLIIFIYINYNSLRYYIMMYITNFKCIYKKNEVKILILLEKIDKYLLNIIDFTNNMIVQELLNTNTISIKCFMILKNLLFFLKKIIDFLIFQIKK